MRARRCGGAPRAGAPLLALALLAAVVPGSAAAQGGAVPAAEGERAAEPDEGGDATWEGRASLSWYFLPDQPDYLIAIGAADRGPLHLEGRYGYEDRKTVSLFAGWNVGFGGDVEVEVVPMLGAVLGQTNGVAPALEFTLTWGPLEYYLETEVVIDLADTSASYLYAWSELSARPVDFLRAGVVIQRTRVIQTSREVTPGLLVGASVWRLDLTAYWFAPGANGQYAALSAGVQF